MDFLNQIIKIFVTIFAKTYCKCVKSYTVAIFKALNNNN